MSLITICNHTTLYSVIPFMAFNHNFSPLLLCTVTVLFDFFTLCWVNGVNAWENLKKHTTMA